MGRLKEKTLQDLWRVHAIHAELTDISSEYLTVILRTRVEYELIADEARSAESAIAHILRE